MNYGFELMQAGYYPGLPPGADFDTELQDAEMVAAMRCRKCGGAMHFEGYYRDGSYIALAVCNQCGNEEEF